MRRSGLSARATAATATAVAALVAGGTALAATPPPPAAAAPATRPAAVDGVWQVEGYGTLLSIAHGRLSTFQTSAVSCLPGQETGTAAGAPGPDGTVVFAEDGAPELTIRPIGRSRARARYADAAGDRSLRRLGSLPRRCGRRESADPRHVFDVFWQTFAENYPFFRLRGVDWQAMRERYRPQVGPHTTPEQLFSVLRAMLEPLDDAHTFLYWDDRHRYAGRRPGTPADPDAYKQLVDRAIARELPGLRTWGGGRIGFTELPGGIGYLRLTSFQDYSAKPGEAAQLAELNRALDSALSRRLHGLVVDLRFNGGGSDALGLALASRLTDRTYPAYAKDLPRFPSLPPQPVLVRPAPAGVPRFTGPVAVLTGDMTVSAGETFVQALLARTPRVARVGEPTQGVFSDTLDRVLPNGWLFSLPNERFLTAVRGGRSFDATGIPPTVPEPAFTAAQLTGEGPDLALDRARALLSPATSG